MRVSITPADLTFRRAEAESWESINPVLALDEPGLDLTNNQVRIGDGVTRWSLLPVATPEDALNWMLKCK